MRKKSKKLVALLLFLIMAISIMPVNGLTVEAAAKPKLAKKSVSIVIGGTSKIKVKNVPKGAKITYKSAKKNIATVSKKGKVKGLKNGTAKITVSVKKNSKTTRLAYKVKVKKPKLSKSTLSLTSGSTAKLSVKNKPKKATYIWTSSSPQVATVNKNGKVITKSEGTATIKVKVKAAKKTYSLSCKVTVKPTSDNTNDAKQTYTVVFDSNGGSSVPSQTVEKNATATQPDAPTRDGYIFDGWFTAVSGGQKFNFGTAITGNITLYAHWSNNSNFSGGSSGGSSDVPETEDDVTDNESTEVTLDDKYELSASEREVVANSSTDVIFYVNSTLTVNSFELFCNNVSTGVLLYDDGDYSSHYDDIPNDGCYTGMYPIDMFKEEDVEFTAQATLGTTSITTNSYPVFVYNEITDAETQYMDKTDEDITEIISKINTEDKTDEAAIKERYDAVEIYLQELVSSGTITDLQYESDCHAFTWTYCDSGLDAFRFIWNDDDPDIKVGKFDDPENESNLRGPESKVMSEFEKTSDLQLDTDISKGNVVILNYYAKGHSWSNNYDSIGEKLTDAGFSVDNIYDFTCNDFMHLQDYNSLILLDSHGNTLNAQPSGTPMICTQEAQTSDKNKTYSSDIKKKRIKQVTLVDGDKVYWIYPELFNFYYAEKPLSNPIVNLGCCRNFPDNNDEMVKAIEHAGASAVCGYSASVGVTYDYAMANTLVDRLLLGDTVDEALAFAKNQNGDKDSYKDSKWQINAVLNRYGSPSATLYHELSNGAFDNLLVLNKLTPWKTYGDARSIYKLSGIKPKSFPKMGIISSGFGSLNDETTSAIYQTFLVPEGATTLSFSYDVVSEEPMEFVGSIYDDVFTVEILNTNGDVLDKLVYESVNTSEWYAVNGIDFPGGDNTTYHTRWKDYSSDIISKYQGQLIVLRFTVYDSGDAIYDTATLIDSVSVG